MLHPQQVVPVRNARRNLDADAGQAAAGPGDGTPERGAVLVDLEPDVPVAVERLGRRAAGRLCHVELQGARVLDARVDAEPDRVAGLDGRGGGVLAPGRQLIAAELGRRHVLDGAVAFEVGGLADVGPVRLCGAVENETWEGVLDCVSAVRGSIVNGG